MTLVVGRVTPLGVRMFADMRITRPEAARAPGFLGAALKLIVLSPRLCVGYAGSVASAERMIRSVSMNRAPNALNAERVLLDGHLASDGAVDFLIASLEPPQLVTIKNGQAQSGETGWIGDGDAFAEYQLHYLRPRSYGWKPDDLDSPERAIDLNIAARMSAGIEAVVFGSPREIVNGVEHVVIPRGGVHPSVGEAVVGVMPRVEDNLFKYMTQSHMHSEYGAFGSAELGAFSYAMLVPTEIGVGAIGIYFHEGRLGVLYAPLILDEPEVYRDLTADGFTLAVRTNRGVALAGFV